MAKNRVIKKVNGSVKVTLPLNDIQDLEWKDGDTVQIKRVGKHFTIKKV